MLFLEKLPLDVITLVLLEICQLNFPLSYGEEKKGGSFAFLGP
jgi:hypothetical protein